MPKPKPWLPQEPGPKLPPYDVNLMAPNVTFPKALDTDYAHGTIVKARIGRHLYAIKLFTTPQTISTPEMSTATKDRGAAVMDLTGISHRLRMSVELSVDLRSRELSRLLLKFTDGLPSQQDKSEESSLLEAPKNWVEMTPWHDSKQRDVYDQMLAVKYFKRMLKDLHKLHFLGIVVRDLKPDQYIDGTLINLSLASTVPHPYGPTAEGPESPFQPRWTYEILAAYDPYNFQVHVIEFWRHNQKLWFSKRARNGVQTKTTVDAYPADRCKKRCFTHTKRFVPMLNYYEEVLVMVTKPMYDPLDFLRRNPGYPVRIAQFGAPARGPPPPELRRRMMLQSGCCSVM